MKSVVLVTILVLISAVSIVAETDRFETAETFLKQRDFDQAADHFLAFVEEQSQHEDAPLALYSAARIRLLAQSRPDEARTLFQQLIDTYPETEWAFYGALRMGEHSQERGDSLEAAALYEEAVRIGEEVFAPVTEASDAQFSALKKCGELYLTLHQYAKAEPFLSTLLESGVEDRRAMPDIYDKLAGCLAGQQRGEAAAQTLLEMIRLYPTSSQACGLCQTREKIDSYTSYEWDPYEYFVEGYTVLRTWPAKASKHMIGLEEKGGAPDLVQTAKRLLPWIYFYSSDFAKAKEAHDRFVELYPDDTDPYVLYFPMYLDSYKEEYTFKQFITSVALLTAPDSTEAVLTPEEEYPAISKMDGWEPLDLSPHFGYYNHLLHVDRPLDSTDVAYIRVFIKSEDEHSTRFEVSNDDPWTIWLNGSHVGEFTGNPGLATLDLVQGWNEVLVKLTQKAGEMVATFRVVNEDNEVESDLICRAAK